MIKKFIEYLKSHVGDIYVWGAQGEIVRDINWIRKMEKNVAQAERAIALYEKRKAEGRNPIYAFDCSGLIVCFLLENGLIKADTTASGLYHMSKSIKKSELKPGDLVFRDNGSKIHHVGVYIGDNTVIEAYGRDLGVVRRHIDKSGANYWNKFGRYDALQDSKEDIFTMELKTVKEGSRGEEVRALQILLNGNSCDCGKADGIAGPKTVAAIQKYQIDHKLVVDGIAGTKTWTKILKGE